MGCNVQLSLLFLKMLASFINAYTTDYCNNFKSCYSSTTNDFSLYVYCWGSLSCFDAQFAVQSITCNGVFSCAYSDNNNKVISGSSMSSEGAYASLNSNLSFIDSGYVRLKCVGTQSCANMFIMSNNSYSDQIKQNLRIILIDVTSSFGAANTRVVSNGNDITVHLRGYYSGYNMTIDCSKDEDSCSVFCYGHSCDNTTLICSEQNVNCNMICGNRYDDSCQASTCTSSNENGNGNGDDIMVSKINNLINSEMNGDYNYNGNYNYNYNYIYDYNYTINNTDLDSRYYDNYNDTCTIKALNFSYQYQYTVINSDAFGSVCCFGYGACQGSYILANKSDVYCTGLASCVAVNITNATNVVIGGSSFPYSFGILFGSVPKCDEHPFINVFNIVLCQSYFSCAFTQLINGRILLCEGYASCYGICITNVEKVVALGYQSLRNATITVDISKNNNNNNSDTNFELYLLGYDSAQSAEIFIIGSNDTSQIQKVKIYCQNNACKNIATKLICGAENSIGVSVCTLATESPTTMPTYYPTLIPTAKPTHSQVEIYLKQLTTFVNDVTVIFALILFIFIAPLLVIISKKKHGNNNSNSNSNSNSNNLNSRKSTFADYISVYGTNANHFVIFLVCLQIYGFYTDVAYLTQLFTYQLIIEFGLFLASMGLCILINMIVVIYFLQIEFSRSAVTLNWFYKYNGIIVITLLVLSITNGNMITSVITSQIFGHSAFYSPISIDTINNLQISLIFSLILEHLPQFAIQMHLIFNTSKYSKLKYDAVTIAALIINCLDILFVIFKVGVWIAVKNIKKQSTSHYNINYQSANMKMTHEYHAMDTMDTND